MKVIGHHTFDMASQRMFAELSGDFNPLHLDPVWSRRELFGDVIAHGVHGVLCALNDYLEILRARGVTGVTIKSLKVIFSGAIYLGRDISVAVSAETDGRATLVLNDDDHAVANATLEWAQKPGPTDRHITFAPPEDRIREPIELEPNQVTGRSGELPLHADRGTVAARFPALAELMPPASIAELLAVSRIVGMECPGLRSVFSSFRLEAAANTGRMALTYRVTKTHARSGMVWLAVTGPTLAGEIQALFRPKPQMQASMADARKRVRDHEFDGQCALIVGGGRGLGEVTAKLLAAGGAKVVITYHTGRDDAERVAADIRHHGGECHVLHCDITAPESAVAGLATPGFPLTHLYAFASPKIFHQKPQFFRPDLFRAFSSVYVDGFSRLCQACLAAWAGPLIVFYPSSEAIEERVSNLAEYAAAKSAGETLCDYLVHFNQRLKIIVKRLPRVATDQTISTLRVSAQDATEAMLPIIREMHALRFEGE